MKKKKVKYRVTRFFNGEAAIVFEGSWRDCRRIADAINGAESAWCLASVMRSDPLCCEQPTV